MIKNILILNLIVIIGCTPKPTEQEQRSNNYLPLEDNSQVLIREAYTVSYNEEYEQANWVAYSLAAYELNGSVERTDNFRADQQIITGSASLEDYKGSGYDRGHLIPAGDCTTSETAMSESFLLSNISPQNPSFNRGIWKQLEEKVRDYAAKYDSVYITTGGVLTGSLETIGSNRVGIPNYYYKALYLPQLNESIAFLLPNQKGEKDLLEYVITVDSLEVVTGIDFYYYVNPVEDNYNIQVWK